MCQRFQLVSGTNQLVSFLLQFCFQILPIVAVLGIIVLVVEHTNNIQNGNHHSDSVSSQTARTSRSLKKRMDTFCILLSLIAFLIFYCLLRYKYLHLILFCQLFDLVDMLLEVGKSSGVFHGSRLVLMLTVSFSHKKNVYYFL